MPFGIPRPVGGPAPVNIPQSNLMPMSDPQVSVPPIAAAMTPKPKINWLGVLADALAGAAGHQGPYAQMMMQQRQQDDEEQRYQRHKGDDLQNQIALYAYKAVHPDAPAPSSTERMIDALVSMPKDDPRRPYYEQAVQHPQAVTVTNPDGSQELRFITPGQSQQPPARPVGKLTPIGAGGQTALPSGGFPR